MHVELCLALVNYGYISIVYAIARANFTVLFFVAEIIISL